MTDDAVDPESVAEIDPDAIVDAGHAHDGAAERFFSDALTKLIESPLRSGRSGRASCAAEWMDWRRTAMTRHELSEVRIYSGAGPQLSKWEPMEPPWVADRRIATTDITGEHRIEYASQLRIVSIDTQGVAHEMRCATPAGPHDGVGAGAIVWAVVCGAVTVVALVGLWMLGMWLRASSGAA